MASPLCTSRLVNNINKNMYSPERPRENHVQQALHQILTMLRTYVQKLKTRIMNYSQASYALSQYHLLQLMH